MGAFFDSLPDHLIEWIQYESSTADTILLLIHFTHVDNKNCSLSRLHLWIAMVTSMCPRKVGPGLASGDDCVLG